MTAAPVTTPKPALRTAPAAASVVPQPTIRTMIVCVPAGTTPRALTTGFPNPLGATAAPATQLWAQDRLRFWQRRELFAVNRGRRGLPTVCAGGPVRRLNLTGMRNAAGFYAGVRHQQWLHAVAGTRPARPWHEFEAQHRADPAKLSRDAARHQFLGQPRINAMRIFNEATAATIPLDPEEVEMFQAGPQAYQNYHAMRAVCGDAALTVTGQRLQPDSDCFADRITYLGQAMRLLFSLPEHQHIVAVTL
jgi:hypothetical protein